MKKLSVTYHAPKGDSKIVEIWGHTFMDGKAEEVTVDDSTHDVMTRHRLFECGKATDVSEETPPKPHEEKKEVPKGR